MQQVANRPGPLPIAPVRVRFAGSRLTRLKKSYKRCSIGRCRASFSPVCFLRVSRINQKITSFGFEQNLEDEYEIGECIGAGTFSTVHEATHRITGERYAVKTIQKRFKEGYLDNSLVARVQHEVDIYQHLGASLNIAYLYGVYETDEHVKMVMELCNGGQLSSKIPKHGMSEKAAKMVVRQVLRSVAQCHAKNVVMRDVKPDNFLFLDESEGSPLKAVDFGLADYCSKEDILWERCGTPVYIAPEVLKRRYGQDSDLWSVGVIAYQVLTGKLPFSGEDGFTMEDVVRDDKTFTNKDIFRGVLYSDLDFESGTWAKISEEGREMVQSLLTRDPKDRISAVEALAHPWLSQEEPEGEGSSVTDSCIQRLQLFGTYGRLKQAALRKIAEFIAQDTNIMDDLCEAFCMMDTSGRGKVEKMDILALLGSDKFSLTEKEIRQLAAQMEMDIDGHINRDEWLTVMADWREVQKSPQWEQWVADAFSWFDVYDKGCLASEELTKMLCGDVCEIPDTVPAALREADIDGDGELMFSEFSALLWTDAYDRLEIFGSRRQR